MRKTIVMAALPLLLLAACEVKVNDDTKSDANASAGDSAAISIDAGGNVAMGSGDQPTSLSLSIPGIELGGEDMNIDGMKLYPGSKMTGVNVTDKDGGNGRVEIRFVSPAAPDVVARYYADAAGQADFTGVKLAKSGAASTVTAVNGEGDPMTITLQPASKGTQGSIVMTDKSAK
ncbi:MAG: hypothetical protein KAY22_21655 [Rhizorhabdus sp.]|uniref:hypothetical protein n=1 Tax=Rhizorhabdus sp. TaxID=1968843 RepID=UPI001B6A5463|nr:hypothetical protein [Rhizorhabdus sp.]MBP8234904.1 hypothetical protein [Rhizorhabdus sp.]